MQQRINIIIAAGSFFTLPMLIFEEMKYTAERVRSIPANIRNVTDVPTAGMEMNVGTKVPMMKAHGLAVVVKGIHGIFYKAGSYRSQQKKRKNEYHHAGAECGDYQKMAADGEYQQSGYSQYHVFSQHGDKSCPYCGDYYSAVELVGVGVLIGRSSAENISQSHCYHDSSDYYCPDYLR